eukprot:CAMPEP_0119357530 /NCGR_PEP_ID=MMETSP1334-20130426/5903_1 /TAXON_ID=127549 /ORGANISM="Calcidiscus leptoporus, Strain RCC1130" /LENGTH=211 /DNA_ID=CAMNT_0007371799 /DNA_START=361 /DNA_END=996 /DNA_ORIENTATION=+
MSVREPVARFESGWRRAVLERHNLEMEGVFHSLPRAITSASEWVRALRDPKHAAHASAMRNYYSSVAWPPSAKDVGQAGLGQLGRFGGNNFLVSQRDLLRNANCTADELHFICAETMEDDWRRLMATFGQPDANLEHANDRLSKASAVAINASTLGDEEAAFMRECLYPWDVALHSKVCRPGGSSHQHVHLGTTKYSRVTMATDSIKKTGI